MKLKMYFFLLAMGAFALTFTLQGCGDDDNDGISVPAELVDALAREYPDARRVEWEMQGTYYVADFYEGNIEKEAWFTKDGVWLHTTWDVLVRDLPQVAQAAVTAAYPGYVIDDVEFVETPGGDYYEVEMEQGKKEVRVKVTAEGEIVA